MIHRRAIRLLRAVKRRRIADRIEQREPEQAGKEAADMRLPGDARIDAGFVTSEQAIATMRRYDVDTVVLWTGKLSRLDSFVQAVSGEQVLVEQVGTGNDDYPRLIYHDPDED